MIQLLAEQDRYTEVGIHMMKEDKNNNKSSIDSLKEATNFLPGDIIASRFEVIRPLRDGCQGAIYLVRHIDFPERKIAMKVLLLDQKEGFEITAARFRNEIVASYGVSHPNVVRAYEYFRDGDLVAYTMEYVSGGDLADKLEDGPLPIDEAVRILAQICGGVQVIHLAGIIHRDLKPENILLTQEGDVKITDFGIARLGRTSKLTEHGGVVGTIDYVSPEYLEEGHVDARSDIYALGVLAYEMIVGHSPFRGDSVIATMTMRLRSDPAAPDILREDCPKELSTIILNALQRDPKNRYQEAKEMQVDLNALASKLGMQLDPDMDVASNVELQHEAQTNDDMQAQENGHHPHSSVLSCLLYTSPSPRDRQKSRMPSSA